MFTTTAQEKDTKQFSVLAYYHFAPIEDPKAEVELHRAFLASLNGKGRIYISAQGINAQMSIPQQHSQEYQAWVRGRPGFSEVEFKEQFDSRHVFSRLTIKVKKELVALGIDIDLSKKGAYLSPTEWKKRLEDSSKKKVVIDVRNDYEWKVGHFEGAERLPYETFKEFTRYVDTVKKQVEEGAEVLMYCTGGIRCEIYSALLKEHGVPEVYQLHGGVIQYGFDEKSKHWLGKLFVFDDRMAIPISEEETPVIGECHHCGEKTDLYYNCANMDCNELFLCCPICLEKHQGTCSPECLEGDRVRPFKFSNEPFRRWYNYAKTKEELKGMKVQPPDNRNGKCNSSCSCNNKKLADGRVE